jgi:hypothetical protein
VDTIQLPPSAPTAEPELPNTSSSTVQPSPADLLASNGRVRPVVLPPARGAVVEARAAVARLVGNFGPALGNVFLISNPWIGLLFWLAIAYTPRLAGFAFVGFVIAAGGQRLLGIEDEPGVGGNLQSNAILASVAAGWMTAPTIYPPQVQIAIAAAVAAVAFVVAAAVLSSLRAKSLPSLLWGYALTAGAMFALFPIGTALASQQFTWWLAELRTATDWATMFFRSLGSLMFAPSVGAGLLVGLAILLWSRAAFAAGVVGWLAGACMGTGIQHLGLTFQWLPAAHNFFVAGMALGAYFVLPGCSSLALAALAGAGASVCAVVLQAVMPAFAYLPLASGMTIWLALGTLALARNDRGFWRNGSPHLVPEEAWWRESFWSQRIGRAEPLLVLPVAGVVEIAQGFDGRLSHTAHLRHALDLLRPPLGGADGASAAPLPASSIWGAAVTAPAAGIVESVRNGIPDNPIGACNFAESWGNYVSIRLDQGGWALLAHFRQWSVVARPGMRVEIGTYLGAAGNSGRSPVPHVHLQVQSGPKPGACTMPFRLANFQSATVAGDAQSEWYAAAVPGENSVVVGSVPDPAVHSMLTGIAPGSALWSAEVRGKIPAAFREDGNAGILLAVTLDPWGRHHLACARGSLLALAAPDAWRVLEQVGDVPLLKLLALAAPSIPYAAHAGMSWSDLAPLIPAGTARWPALSFAPYRTRPFIHTRTVCTAVPTPAGGCLELETAIAGHGRALPTDVACTFDRIRGATRLEARFEKGSVVYTVLSFTPGLPF